jgi:hypothetical protein
MSDTEVFSMQNALRFGFDVFKENAGYCTMLMLSIEAISIISAAALAGNLTVAAMLIMQLDVPPPDTFFYSFLVLYMFIRTLMNVPLSKAFLMLSDGRKISADELLGFDTMFYMPAFFRLLAANFIFACYTLFGTFLLIVPGIFVAANLRYYKFFIVDQNADAVESLRESYEIAGNKKPELVSFFIATSLIKAVGLLCLGVGVVPASAICTLAEAFAYKTLLEQADSLPQHS